MFQFRLKLYTYLGILIQLFVTLSCATTPVTIVRSPEISVMTFNILYDYENQWEQRKLVLQDFLLSRDPDILGLQEVVSAIPAYFLDVNRPLEWLETEFGDRYHILGTEAFSPLLVRASGFRVLDSGVYWLSFTPDIPWSNHWNHIVPTSVTWALLESLSTENQFIVKNTHLGVFNPSGRRRSIELIYSRIPESIPIILMGDFNDRPNQYVARFLRSRGFVDSHQGMGGSFRLFARSNFAPIRIDYIMVRGFDVIDRRIDSPRHGKLFVSDHKALSAELAFGYTPPIGPAPEGWPFE